jgi:hypothetical protein
VTLTDYLLLVQRRAATRPWMRRHAVYLSEGMRTYIGGVL